jgi:cytochrome c oxidase assembly factor CtaG
VYAFLLPRPALVALARRRRLRAVFRWLRRPLVAIPVWILILYGWHFRFAFEAAVRNDLVHALQHQTFVLGAVLVWWSVIEPRRRRLPGDLWKVPYLVGARLAGMFLGMAFILLRSPAYESLYGRTAPDHGLSAMTDQQVAGGMMLALDLLVMLFAVGFFFYRSAQDHDRAERAPMAAR